ncbi:hypothetical protein ACJMK2_008563 [Sinanodonta woodiana]|uniref:Chitin-binding type-4 domain-containing protein n=1 Tax=Sinanodonta woodiana TaxID=1069815 RepID=A0ABD3VMS9_SINWO
MRIGYICLFLAVLACVFVEEVGGSAFLLDPPGRSALWNFQIRAPVNYNYMSLNCGGKLVERLDNGTVTCGLCGDDIDGPQENLFGGKYVSRVIFSRFYHEGDVVEFRVWNNNPERGWYEFRLCQNGDVLTQQCLDQNLLFLPEVNDTYYPVRDGTGPRTIKVKLPNGVICNHCVIQWRFHTATEFGCTKDFWCGPGFGPQPEYYNCADVVIGRNGSVKPPTVEDPVFNTLDYGSSYDTEHNHTTSTPAPTNLTTTTEPVFSTDPIEIGGSTSRPGGFIWGGRDNRVGLPWWILLIPFLFARRVEPVVRWYTYPVYPVIPISGQTNVDQLGTIGIQYGTVGNGLSSNLVPVGVSRLNTPLINAYPQKGTFVGPQPNLYGNNVNYIPNSAYASSGTYYNNIGQISGGSPGGIYYNNIGQISGGSPGGIYYNKVGQISGGSFYPNIPANNYGNQIGNTIPAGWNNNLGNNNFYNNGRGPEGVMIDKSQFNMNPGMSQGKPLDGGFSTEKKSEPLSGSNVHSLYQGLLTYSATQNKLPQQATDKTFNVNRQDFNGGGGNLKDSANLNNANQKFNFGNVNPNLNPNNAGFIPTAGNQNSNFDNTNFNQNFFLNPSNDGFIPNSGNQNLVLGNTNLNPNFKANVANLVPTNTNIMSGYSQTNGLPLVN